MTTSPSFTTAEGLRLLLVRLHYSGRGAWRDDVEATELMEFCMTKYAALAHKHGFDPADAATAAFEVMRTRSVRTAGDPWAVVTRAVQVTLIYDARAQGLLCSTHQARRSAISAHHDAERFSDREASLADFHPAFQVPAEQDTLDFEVEQPDNNVDNPAPTGADEAVEGAVVVFTSLGWPPETTRSGIEYVCARLIEAGSRPSAFESLRRDRHARAFLDLDQTSWLALLRAVLGNQHPDHVHTSTGRGMLLRLMIGSGPAELLEDDELVHTIANAVPSVTGGSSI